MKVEVIRTDGSREEHEIPGKKLTTFEALYPLAGCDTFDTINLRDGRWMLVDDNGYETEAVEHGERVIDDPNSPLFGTKAFVIENRVTRARKPVNLEATKLYHAICVPGTTHQIVGDVVIVRERDMR